METFIIKLGATGDVVRTTPLLHKLAGNVSWVTAAKNLPLLDSLRGNLRCVPWEGRSNFLDHTYDLVINLEDTAESAKFLKSVKCARAFGALEKGGKLDYSDDSRSWFDLSLISRFGKKQADKLKLENRRTYQELIFSGLGFSFSCDKYVLPAPAKTNLSGDVCLAPKVGHVWAMKNWAFYGELQKRLEARGLTVNVLPERASLLEHLGDVASHRCLVSGDTLPMHFALGAGRRCVTIFNCTSPWEIFDYGLQRQIVSPLLAEFFFQRGMDERAVTATPVETVFDAVMEQLK